MEPVMAILSSRAAPRSLRSLALALAIVCVPTPAARAQCPGWSNALSELPDYHTPRDVVMFDDGQGGGPTLWVAYAGGSWLLGTGVTVARSKGTWWLRPRIVETGMPRQLPHTGRCTCP